MAAYEGPSQGIEEAAWAREDQTYEQYPEALPNPSMI